MVSGRPAGLLSELQATAEYRARVFQRFVRLDATRARDDGGSGLGLAIVAGLVHAHGGSVLVRDSALGGVRVEMSLLGSEGPGSDP